MPYYHVYIENNALIPRYGLDKTDLSEIKEEIVIPYLKGERFEFNGYFLDKTRIQNILIKESEYSSMEFVAATSTPKICQRPFDIVKSPKYSRNITNRVLSECRSQLQEVVPKSEALAPNKPKTSMDKSKVFIVHGHDDAAKSEAARFVENLGFKAIILHEQASSGKTIIEKIEEYTNVGFGIVLYTPCDLGASQEEKELLKPRARQNVVFEHGYLMGKIGRENVCALVKGDIEKPTDISGVVYIPMGEGDSWKLAVAKEMKKSGYDVDFNKILG